MEKKVKRNGDARINSLTKDQISRIKALAFGTMLFNDEDDFKFLTLHDHAIAHYERALGVDECLGTDEYSRAFLEALSQVEMIFRRRKSTSNQLVFESNYSVVCDRPSALFTIYETEAQLGYERTYHYNSFLMGSARGSDERAKTKIVRLHIGNWYDLYSFDWRHVALTFQGRHTNCLVTTAPNIRLQPGIWVVDRHKSILKGWGVLGDRHIFVCVNLSEAGPIMKYHVVRDMDDQVNLMAEIFSTDDAVCDFADYASVGEALNHLFELALSLSKFQNTINCFRSEEVIMNDEDLHHTSAFYLALRGRNPNLSIF